MPYEDYSAQQSPGYGMQRLPYTLGQQGLAMLQPRQQPIPFDSSQAQPSLQDLGTTPNAKRRIRIGGKTYVEE